MIQKLRKKLTIAYTFTTWIIFTIIFLTIFLFNEKQLYKQALQAFQTQVDSVLYYFQTEHVIKNSWMAQLEFSQKLILSIEENNHSFLYPGSWSPPTDRNILIDSAQNHAYFQGIDVHQNPLSSNQINSPVFNLKGKKGEFYFASVSILPTQSGWKSFTLIQFRPLEKKRIFLTRLSLGFLEFISLVLLFFINWFFIGLFLRPVEKGKAKQAEFIASASHELKSPLAVIQANASAALLDQEHGKKFLNGIEKECQRMGRLIDEMLLLTNFDAKNWQIKKEAVNLDTLLIETYELFLPICKKKEQNLSLNLPENTMPLFIGDMERLQQVLAILLDNAIAYTPQKGKIQINATYHDSKIKISVQDNGIGITKEQKEHIFDRFYRGDSSHSAKEHFGLGLSIALELVHLQKGTLFCESKEGEGTCFYIELPKT